MMRNLKVLGIAMAAVFAMSAVIASAASADQLTSESSPVTLTGAQIASENNKLTSPEVGTISCETADYNATSVATPTRTITVTPVYTNCRVFGFLSHTPIHMNGCDYLLHVNTAANDTTGTADLVCPAGATVTATAISVGTTKCTVHIAPQTNLAKIEATNIGSGATREIELHLEIENIAETHTKGSGLGACPAGSSTKAVLEGTVKVTGETTSATPTHVGIFLS